MRISEQPTQAEIPTILFANDDPDLVRGLARIVQMKGYSALPVIGGLEAVKTAEKHRPVVAVLDIQMPDLNGVEACRRIKKLCPETKVIMMTGYSEQEQQARDAGAETVLSKPLDLQELFRVLEPMLEPMGKQ